MFAVTGLTHSAAYWSSQNIVLDKGQIGIESDTGASKIGDGVHAWNALSYREQPEKYSIATGVNTYTLSMVMPSILGYYSGMKLRVKFNETNTGASTINLNGFGAKSIKKGVTGDMESGEILANGIYDLFYDGTNFQIK